MFHFNYHAKEGFNDTSKRKASQAMNNPTVIDLVDEDDEMHCLGCSFFSGTGAVFKRSCQGKNNFTYGSSAVSGQNFYSGYQKEADATAKRDADAEANGSKGGGFKEGCSHTPSKTQHEDEHKEFLKSLLAKEIKRQVLDGLGEIGQSQVQDLEVIEIEDIVSDAYSEEKHEGNQSKPYFVKMKLLATVCIPVFLQTAPQSSLEQQPVKQMDGLDVDGKEFPSSRQPAEHHQVASRKPLGVFTEQCNPNGLQEKSSSRVSQVNFEKSLCNKVPLNASIINTDCSMSYSCDIPKWRDRFDTVACGRFDTAAGGRVMVNDFEVHDFDADKSEDNFSEGQIWALYDDKDGMPRHYAQITDVHSVRPFEVSITWLEPDTRSMEALMRLSSGVSITCGVFELRDQQDPIKLTHVHHFSHPVKSQAGLEGEILIIPSKGEVWALYKDQIACSFTSQRIGGKYELVQVVDKNRDTHTLTVVPLLKIGGFRTRFIQEEWPFTIASKDFLKFSHQIPAYMLREKPRAYLELDPASTPELFD